MTFIATKHWIGCRSGWIIFPNTSQLMFWGQSPLFHIFAFPASPALRFARERADRRLNWRGQGLQKVPSAG